MLQIVIDAWKEVWQYFVSATSEYERLYSMVFEYYVSPNQVALYIAVK